MPHIDKDFILSSVTVLEIIILLIGIFCLFKTTLLISLIIIIYQIYKNKKLKKPEYPSENVMEAAIYIPTISDHFAKMKIVKIPYIGEDEVLIVVKAAAINPVDYKVNTSLIPIGRWFMSNTIGKDVVGEIVEKGSKVTYFEKGESVFGYGRSGSLAKYCVCKESQIAKLNTQIDKYQYAGCALAGTTALQSLLWFYKENDIKDLRILIIGASGGVGNLAVQICNYYGCRELYGTCSTKNVEFVKKFTNNVVDYNKNLDSQIGNIQFDLIYDTVTSMTDYDQKLIYSKYLSPVGKYVQINGRPGEFAMGAFNCHIAKCLWLEKKNFHLHLLNWNRNDIQKIGRMIEEGKMIVNTQFCQFTQEDLINGFSKLKSRRTVGKIVYQIA